MTDIVDRLRTMEPCQSDDWKIAREAADTIERLRAKLLRDGASCGCHWTFADEKDLEGTQDKECAYHMDQKRELRATSGDLAKALEEMLQVNAAMARVIAEAVPSKAGIMDDLEEELRAAGIADGFGARAHAALGEAKDE